jgi:hypothetical protein
MENPDELKSRMADGSQRLRGVAGALRVLATHFYEEEHVDPVDMTTMLELLARDVDLEATAMSDAECALAHIVGGKLLGQEARA